MKKELIGLLSLGIGPYSSAYTSKDLSPHPYFKPGKNKRTKPKKK